MVDTGTLLTVRNLCTWFELRRWGFARAGVVRAVDGVSFELRAGEAVAIVGESGCGKSTLARTLLGLLRPTQGQVAFEGSTQLGFIQQDPYAALPPFMDVRRILHEPLIIHHVRNRAEREQRVREALTDVKLTPVEDFLTKFPHMLSGGQQQRVVIARALLLRPQLLIADEPVSMLDASVRVEILDVLRSLQQTYGLSLLFITHDLSTVRHFAERVFVMYAGKIVEQAPTDALLEAPQHPYTRALLAAIPDPDPENAALLREVPPGEPPSLLHPPPGCRFHPRCPLAIPGRCDRVEPPEVTQPDGHRVTCWLHVDGDED